MSDGAVDVPDGPGLRIEVDTDRLQQYRVDSPESRPMERALIEVIRKDEDPMYFTDTSQMFELALKGEFPFYEHGIRTRIVPKDECENWTDRYQAAGGEL